MLARLGITRREAGLLALLMLAGFMARLVFVLATKDHQLVGDEIEYDLEGRFISDGKWFWTTTPTGLPHAGMWKTPVYPAFVGILYKLLGDDPDRVLIAQTLIGPIVIALTWYLARKLFDTRVAFAAAAVVAICPFVWQFEVRLLAESLATPLTLLLLILLLDEEPTGRRVALVGAVFGLLMLTRPSGVFLVPVMLVVFVMAARVRRGVLLTVAALAIAVLVTLPWMIRNHDVSGDWTLSSQTVTPYGTFNDDAANDERNPYAWRIYNKRDAPLLDDAAKLGEFELVKRLRHNAVEYVKDHPSAVPEAFFWNGITRLWDVRRPNHVLSESASTGRPRWLASVGLYTYWPILGLALVALWLLRRRPELLVPLLVMAAAASLVYTADAETRYRAPLDPLIAILACFAAVTLLDTWRARRA